MFFHFSQVLPAGEARADANPGSVRTLVLSSDQIAAIGRAGECGGVAASAADIGETPFCVGDEVSLEVEERAGRAGTRGGRGGRSAGSEGRLTGRRVMLLHKGAVTGKAIATDVTGTVKARCPPESGGGKFRRWAPPKKEEAGHRSRELDDGSWSQRGMWRLRQVGRIVGIVFRKGRRRTPVAFGRLVRFSAADVTKIDGACGDVVGRAHALRPMDSVQFDVVQ